jgi:H+-transporting ATPase
MAGMSILCSDKTGTLTMNKMVIQEETPIYKEGESQYSLLRYAAMAAKWKEPPRDALDTLTLTAVDMASLEAVEQLDFMPFDPIVKRTGGTVREDGKLFKTTKGAPHVLLRLCNNDEVKHRCEADVHSFGLRGIRCLAVAKSVGEVAVPSGEHGVADEAQYEMLGLLTFLDPPRPDTKKTIEDANLYGVAVKMITGDHLLIAKETAKQLGMNDYIKSAEGLPLLDPVTKKKPPYLAKQYGDMILAADGFAEVFPEHKYLIVECLRELGYKTGMTGDGVNDAPALKRADVGVAVHGATDAARAAADIVLTQPGLSTIVTGILVSRKIFARIRNFMVYRIAATLQLLIFFFIAVFLFKPVDYMPHDWRENPLFPDHSPWPGYFHMPVLMLMLITLLNDGTLISIGYDNVTPLQTPEKWNIKAMFLVASVLAGVALLSSLLLLQVLLNSWNPTGFLGTLQLGKLSYGQVTTSIYLKVSVSDFLTLFSSRCGEDWFWSSRPANILLHAAGIALILSTVLAIAWPASYPDDIFTLGLGYRQPYSLFFFIWMYCLFWWLIQDACKVYCVYLMKKKNWFGYNSTGKVVLPPSTLRYIKENKKADMEKIDAPHH